MNRPLPSGGIADWTARELSRAIHAREVSCAEAMAAFLDRIERLNPVVNAIVAMKPREAAMAEAAEADAELAAGRSRGWLHGLPQAPKDLTATADIVTAMGSPILAGKPAPADSILVERLRGAGAILIGKTNVPEFGLGSHTYNPVYGPTLNAWDQTRSAGGSSGGAAVALALGMLPVADGSDMMGSLRNPAGWNGVYGFRPTPGRIPAGPGPEIWLQQLSTDGPMGRDVADLAALLATLAGWDPRAPLSLDGDGAAFAGSLDAPTAGLRIGWLGDLGGRLAMEPGVIATCEAALRLFADLGVEVEPVLPDFDLDALFEAWTTLRSFLVAGALGPHYDAPASRALLKPAAVWEVERGRALSAPAVFRASATRSAWLGEALRLHGRFDFLAIPTAQLFPFELGQDWPQAIAGREMDSYLRWMEGMIVASMTGGPALAVPAGFGPAGLPIGLQLIGPPRADLAVLRLGHAYDRLQPFTARRSPLLE
ncbi:amidase [Amaricoccus sp.]|uniref:amidase n=1 Tax=Amaricoccus sp. TaxID=1872485 RepID=UPI001B6C8B39|nr:amidase [Amaricoccus sp.]MBP7001293.1 amidase [Amaricoccus sp.]